MIPNGVLCDTVHRPYCQNTIQFHKTHKRVISFSSQQNYSFHRTAQNTKIHGSFKCASLIPYFNQNGQYLW